MKVLSIADHYHKLVKTAASRILRFTCPLFVLDDNCRPGYYGSAILTVLSQRYFLVSAAHVLDDSPKPLFVPLENDSNGLQLSLEKGIHSTPVLDGKKRIDDKLDFAFTELNESEIATLSKDYEFLKERYLPKNDYKPPHTVLLICGYPETRVKKGLDPTQSKYKPKPFIHSSTMADCKYYTRYGFDIVNNILIDYDKKIFNETKQKVTSPLPFGLSGSGLWIIDKIVNTDHTNPEIHLLGIQNEYQSSYGGIISSTKIGTIARAIRKTLS